MIKKVLVCAVLFTASLGFANHPKEMVVGYPGFGYYPFCSNSGKISKSIPIAEGNRTYLLRQRKEFQWSTGKSSQNVDVVLTDTFQEMPSGKAEDFPALGIYQQEIETHYFNIVPGMAQWNHYMLMTLLGERCWAHVRSISENDGTYWVDIH